MTGRLASWNADRATATGLPAVAHGDVVEIDGAGATLVTALRADHVELAPLSRCPPATADATVRRLDPLAIPTGDELIGRELDALGSPLDGGPPLARTQVAPVFGRAPTPHAPGGRRLTLGLLVYDLQRFRGVGTRLLAIGDARPVLQHFVEHWQRDGKLCITATVGASPAYASRARLAASSGGHGIHIRAGADPTPAAQWLVPWTAVAIARAMRARGRDAIVVLDSLDAWRLPVRQCGWRGDFATQLLQLTASAWAEPTGSVTIVAHARDRDLVRAVERAELDGIIDLERAHRGAPEPLATKLMRPPIRVPDLARISAAWVGGDPAVRACLRYREHVSTDLLEQLACLLAVVHLNIAEPRVPAFVDAFTPALRAAHAALLATARATQRLDEPARDALLATARQLLQSVGG